MMPTLFRFPFLLLTLSMLQVFSGPFGPPGPAVGDTFLSDLE